MYCPSMSDIAMIKKEYFLKFLAAFRFFFIFSPDLDRLTRINDDYLFVIVSRNIKGYLFFGFYYLVISSYTDLNLF